MRITDGPLAPLMASSRLEVPVEGDDDSFLLKR
jgi:hypothetical protein